MLRKLLVASVTAIVISFTLAATVMPADAHHGHHHKFCQWVWHHHHHHHHHHRWCHW